MRLPKITEVERLALRPGDVLFVHVDEKLTQPVAELIRERISALIEQPDVKIVVLDRGMGVKVGRRAAD